jgi:phosphatidylglycerophosphatase A
MTRNKRGSWWVKTFASFFYLGYSKAAPGTFGAAGGLGFYLLLRYLFPGFIPEPGTGVGWEYLLFLAAFFMAGVYLSNQGEKEWRQKDSPRIVIDEAFSIFITFIFLPVYPVLLVVIGFALNRLFDILKPFPTKLLEKAPGGWGVMLDDLMAGIYSNLALRVVIFLIFAVQK